MNAKQPTLSVVMSNYNHAKFLKESLQAILDQSFPLLELIVIDDASTDHSIELIADFAKNYPMIRFVRHDQNQGVLVTINQLLALASGDYVYFGAADDKVVSGLFEKSMQLLKAHPQAGLCSSLSLLIAENGVGLGLFQSLIVSRTACFLDHEKTLTLLQRHGAWFMGNTTIYRRSALIEMGGFIPELQSYCDGFISQVLALKYGVCFIPEPLALWRRMETGYASTTTAKPDLALDIMHHSLRLMRSTYRDLFPEVYVDHWQRRWRFSRSLAFIVSSQKSQIAYLRRFLPSSTRVESAFFGGLQLLLKVERLFTILYLTARLRRADLWPALTQKLKYYFYSMKERTNK